MPYPYEPETVNGIQDDDGCPDVGPEHVTWDRTDHDVLHFDRAVIVPLHAQSLLAPSVSLLTQAAQRIRALGSEMSRVHVEVEAIATPAGETEAARQAQLVGEVLLAHGVPQRSVTPGVFHRPAPAPRVIAPGARPVPVVPLVPGRVSIRVERLTAPTAP